MFRKLFPQKVGFSLPNKIIYVFVFTLICFLLFEPITVVGDTPSKNNSLSEISTQSHSINFPINIIFELTGKSHLAIDQILFIYQVSNTNISGYNHTSITHTPMKDVDSATTDHQFTATSKLATSGSNYIPSGTSISYYFEIHHVNGQKQLSDSVSFDYLDPNYDWQKLESKTMTVFWHDISKNKIEEIVSKSETVIEKVSDLLDLKQSQSMRAVIVNTQKESLKSFPKISMSATRDNIYGGFAFHEYGVFIIRGLSVDSMIHEATHLLMNQKMNSPLSRVPAWLSEGLAMYFEIDSKHRTRTAEIGYIQKKLRPLSSMESVPGKSMDIRIFYAHSQEIVRYLIDTEGKEKFLNLLIQINSGARADTAVIDVYGRSLDDLDKSWRATLNPTFDRRLLVDPGTFWTSLILGTAFLFAVIVSTMTWAKRKISNQSETMEEIFEIRNTCEDQRHH